MIKTLIIFTDLVNYVSPIRWLVDLTKEEYDFFRRADGYIVNFSDFDEEKELSTLVINDAVSSLECTQGDVSLEEKKWAGKWLDNLRSTDIEDTSDVQKIICCGWTV